MTKTWSVTVKKKKERKRNYIKGIIVNYPNLIRSRSTSAWRLTTSPKRERERELKTNPSKSKRRRREIEKPSDLPVKTVLCYFSITQKLYNFRWFFIMNFAWLGLVLVSLCAGRIRVWVACLPRFILRQICSKTSVNLLLGNFLFSIISLFRLN